MDQSVFLKQLNLSGGGPFNKDIKKLLFKLIFNNIHIEELILCGENHMLEDEAEVLAKAIEGNTVLEKLNLNGWILSEKEKETLKAAMRKNSKIDIVGLEALPLNLDPSIGYINWID